VCFDCCVLGVSNARAYTQSTKTLTPTRWRPTIRAQVSAWHRNSARNVVPVAGADDAGEKSKAAAAAGDARPALLLHDEVYVVQVRVHTHAHMNSDVQFSPTMLRIEWFANPGRTMRRCLFVCA
jgi:hypothetical protein